MSPALPMTPLRATAATMTTDGEAGIASLPALGFRPDLTTTGPRACRAATGRPARVLPTRGDPAAGNRCTPPAADPSPGTTGRFATGRPRGSNSPLAQTESRRVGEGGDRTLDSRWF